MIVVDDNFLRVLRVLVFRPSVVLLVLGEAKFWCCIHHKEQSFVRADEEDISLFLGGIDLFHLFVQVLVILGSNYWAILEALHLFL